MALYVNLELPPRVVEVRLLGVFVVMAHPWQSIWGIVVARYRRHTLDYIPSYTARAPSKRDELSRSFGGIDVDIERIFLSLTPQQLEGVFAQYRTAHGVKAEVYARKTYEKWRSNAVKMSGQTAERLLDLVPPFLSADLRFELIKKLRRAHLRPVHRTLATSPETWRQDLAGPVRELVTKSAAFSLPTVVTSRATWLANGDASAAQSLLAAIEQEEAIIRIRYLEAEFHRIEALIRNLEHTRSVTHTISLPQGTITVTISRSQKTLWQSVVAWFS